MEEIQLTSWGNSSLSMFIPSFTGFYTSQVVVQDFWTINSMSKSREVQKSLSASLRQCIMERYQLRVWREGHATCGVLHPHFVWRFSSWVVALNGRARGHQEPGLTHGRDRSYCHTTVPFWQHRVCCAGELNREFLHFQHLQWDIERHIQFNSRDSRTTKSMLGSVVSDWSAVCNLSTLSLVSESQFCENMWECWEEGMEWKAEIWWYVRTWL